MAQYVYHTKFFKIGAQSLFKFITGATLGPFYKLGRRRYVTNSGTITRVQDLNTKVTQYPNPKP